MVSCVQDSIGKSAQAAARAGAAGVRGHKPVVITNPYGACDPVTNQAHFTKFPVPEAYVQPPTKPFMDPARNPPDTITRASYRPRSAGGNMKSLQAARRQAADSQALKVRLLRATAAADASCVCVVVSDAGLIACVDLAPAGLVQLAAHPQG